MIYTYTFDSPQHYQSRISWILLSLTSSLQAAKDGTYKCQWDDESGLPSVVRTVSKGVFLHILSRRFGSRSTVWLDEADVTHD